MRIDIKAAVLGLSTLTACPTVAAAGFGLAELIQIGQALPDVQNQDALSIDATQASLRLNNGREFTISSPDGQTSLANLVKGDSVALDVNGNRVNVTTTAASLEAGYDKGDQAAVYSISSVVDTRPLTLSWEGAPDSIASANRLSATLNGQPVTLVLPEGKTLADFKGSTPITLLDASGNPLVEERSLNALSPSRLLQLAARLGMLDTDMALRGAQKQAMAQNFGILSSQIDSAMQPGRARSNAPRQGQRFAAGRGFNVWVASEASDLEGRANTTAYDGDGKAAFVGIDWKRNDWLLGIATGHSSVDITTTNRVARVDLGGDVIAPYAAVAVDDGRWVFDAVGLYQSLDGRSHNRYLDGDVDLDGERWGARGSTTYYLPRLDQWQVGVTAGGAYLNDKLQGRYLGTQSDYGVELGELFGGLKLGYDLPHGQFYASVLHYHNITANVDSRVNLIEEDDPSREQLGVGLSHQLGQRWNVDFAGVAVVGSSDTRYRKLQATLAYRL
ncbi:autotransporter outer membrane beta-barrel domain-containing protein [Salinicola sp. RZ23]|uniref:autotransporter outer membrane beta-barrel domain-containing protein n=1 Tax=Salinicola sp. RZ23 TaxID=1949087 RepID=UPI000DA1C653|nr:autotransporter outer membrane beta-barrel domain-containing protein [Salinicola sp. RZ23]